MDVPSTSSNAQSAFQCGMQISDTIYKMINQGFLMGPLCEDEIPFSESRVSGIMAKIKPDNSARMILNLSKGDSVAVNDGIQKTEYPILMSSTT